MKLRTQIVKFRVRMFVSVGKMRLLAGFLIQRESQKDIFNADCYNVTDRINDFDRYDHGILNLKHLEPGKPDNNWKKIPCVSSKFENSVDH